MNEKNKKKDIIYGIRPVLEAVSSGKDIEKVFIKKGLGSDLFRQLFQEIRKIDIPFQYVPVERLNRITGKNHQGVAALVSPVEYHDIEQVISGLFEHGINPLILILDSVTDVRNFGSIARTAECAGVNAIVFPIKNSAAINADTIKTSAGALHKIPICRVKQLNKTIEFLKNSGLIISAATEKAEELYTSVDYSVPSAIVMGAEDTGISREILTVADHLVKIPVVGSVESLNVSVAAGVLLFEALRQRDFIPS